MTAKKLSRLIAEMADKYPRARVCVSKETFSHPLESDGATIQEVHVVSAERITQLDGDGFMKVLVDGQVSEHLTIVLKGELGEP